MDKQELVDRLKQYGELNPYRNIKIWTGQKVSEMVFFREAIRCRGYNLIPEKYYVFEDIKGRIFMCNGPEEAVDTASKYSAFDYGTIEPGDYVDFGPYGKFYVVGENIGGTKFLVDGRTEGRPYGPDSFFYIEKHYAENIIRKKID